MKNKKKAIMFGTALAVLAGLTAGSSFMKTSLESQNMAQRWSSDGSRYAQISVFVPAGKESRADEEAVSLRKFIDDKLTAESYKPANDGAKVWNDSWSSVMNPVKVSTYDEFTGRTTECQSDINIIGTEGDFFEFHPLELVSGDYIYPDGLKNTGAVLDEEAAWKIFSSVDIIGMKFTAGTKEFEVAGVVRAEKNKAVKNAYPAAPVIYVHYSALSEAELDNSLSCYESVIPDPVSNYARNIILSNYGIDTMTEDGNQAEKEENLPCIIVDNTNRYSVSRLFNKLRNFGKDQVVSKPVSFPYWENSARVNAAWLTLIFFINILLAAYILITLIIFAAKLYLNRTWHLKDYIEKLTDKYTYKKKTSDYINVETEENSEREKKYE